MRLFARADDSLIFFLGEIEDNYTRFTAPDDAAASVEFDGDTNPELIAGLRSDWESYRLVNGQLQRNGVPVTVNPPGQAFQDVQAAPELLARLESGGNVTAAELRQGLRLVLRLLRRWRSV